MHVKLAGFNVDIENIKKLNEILNKEAIEKNDIEDLKKIHWTPETISASYARISRDPRSIGELREDARREIEKARKSNKNIIFEMGHSSIAEHAVFNTDIIDITRLLSEEIEKTRLASFTEKSQRYIKINKGFLIPEEFKKDTDLLRKYETLAGELFDAYQILHEKAVPFFLDKNPGIREKTREYRDIINLAKEDARYILPLSTFTQVGMTLNARSMEKIIKKLFSSRLHEANILAQCLSGEIKHYAPSLIKYVTPSEYDTLTYSELRDEDFSSTGLKNTDEVEIIKFDDKAFIDILAGVIVKTSCIDFKSAIDTIKKWGYDRQKNLFYQSIKYLGMHDPVPREFELCDITFNILISAAGFAQLKRHRMATIIDGDYSPEHGVKIPPSIIECGMKDFFMDKINKTEELFDSIKKESRDAAGYILTNAHRKNIILKCNLRELVHITRLRSDSHAQWDIRNISDKMAEITGEKFPLLCPLLCGKDEFDREKMNP